MHYSSAIDLSEIAAFVSIAETGSIAAAARRMSRDATVISKRLSSVEAKLGVRLVERTTRRLVLTEAGRTYLDRVAPLLTELDTANREAASLADGEPRGHLRLSLPSTFSRMWLTPLILEFLQAHPKVSIEAEYSNRFADLVGEGFDLAVRIGELSDSRLVARRIGSRRRLVCASPAYLERRGAPAHPHDLLDHACLSFTGRPDPLRWSFRAPDGSTASVVVSGPLASDDADLLLQVARAGAGILYSTDWHAGEALARQQLVEILHGWTLVDEGAIYLITPGGGGLPPKTRAFADFIARRLAQAPWLASSPKRELAPPADG